MWEISSLSVGLQRVRTWTGYDVMQYLYPVFTKSDVQNILIECGTLTPVKGHYSVGCCRVPDGFRVRFECWAGNWLLATLVSKNQELIGWDLKNRTNKIPLPLNVLCLIFNLSWWQRRCSHLRYLPSLPDMDGRCLCQLSLVFGAQLLTVC